MDINETIAEATESGNRLREEMQVIKEDILANDEELTDLDYYDTLNYMVIEEFLDRHNLKPEKSIRQNLNSIVTLGRYILLKDEQDKISTKLENLLCTVFNKEETKWKINEDFSNSFYFSRTSEDGYFETMLIKYKYNSKKDEFKFILAAGPVGWDVTLQELKTLIEKKSSINNNLCLDKHNSDDISFRYNDMEIIIRKIV